MNTEDGFAGDLSAGRCGFKDGDFRLDLACVAILGLGLMGGSLALALQGKCARLVGADRDPQAVALARRMGLVDQAELDPAAILAEADLIVLAAPVDANLGLAAALPELAPGPALVIDLGSTKSAILAALADLPERFDPLGGHPMCGKEVGGLANASAGLFQGAPFVLSALERSTACARRMGETLAWAVGARPIWLEAGEHDWAVAATSHLPYLVANTLAAVTPPAAAPLIGPGWRSATRLAGTPRNMIGPVLRANRANLLEALQRFQGRLSQVEAALQAEDWGALEALLAEGDDWGART